MSKTFTIIPRMSKTFNPFNHTGNVKNIFLFKNDNPFLKVLLLVTMQTLNQGFKKEIVSYTC